MAEQFSDPAWWPKPPPKPPKAISLPKVVFGTLLPLVGVGAIAFLIATQSSGSSSSSTAARSIAAFEACLKDQGALSASERSNPRQLQQAADTCRGHLPAGVAEPDFTQQQPASADGERQAFEQCMQTAAASLPRGRGAGPFGGVSSKARQAYRNAVTMCRALSSSGGTGPAPAATTSTPSTA